MGQHLILRCSLHAFGTGDRMESLADALGTTALGVLSTGGRSGVTANVPGLRGAGVSPRIRQRPPLLPSSTAVSAGRRCGSSWPVGGLGTVADLVQRGVAQVGRDGGPRAVVESACYPTSRRLTSVVPPMSLRQTDGHEYVPVFRLAV